MTPIIVMHNTKKNKILLVIIFSLLLFLGIMSVWIIAYQFESNGAPNDTPDAPETEYWYLDFSIAENFTYISDDETVKAIPFGFIYNMVSATNETVNDDFLLDNTLIEGTMSDCLTLIDETIVRGFKVLISFEMDFSDYQYNESHDLRGDTYRSLYTKNTIATMGSLFGSDPMENGMAMFYYDVELETVGAITGVYSEELFNRTDLVFYGDTTIILLSIKHISSDSIYEIELMINSEIVTMNLSAVYFM